MAKKKKKSNKSSGKAISDKRFITEKARSLPIWKCYTSIGWEKYGTADVIVSRERANGNLCVGCYQCDTWCMGVTDAYGIVNISKEDFNKKIPETFEDLKECDYTYAHNLIYGAEAYAADAHIKPHYEFALWSHILEEDTKDVPLIEMEFGDKGKYHLVAEAGSKEAHYAPVLKDRLGDDFICEIYDEDDDNEKEALSEFERLLTNNGSESIGEALQRVSDGFRKSENEDQRHPGENYSYKHPEYPSDLDIKHEFIAEEFKKPSNFPALPTDVIDRILALPTDEVRTDLINLIMFTIGKTWKAIDDNTLEWDSDDTLLHSLAFLTEIGGEAGLDAVMEVMRQDSAFHEFHFGDIDGKILPDAIYVTGRNRTDVLEEFLMHPGYDGYAKGYVSDALSYIAMEEPDRRDEIIEIYRRYLIFMQENMPSRYGCSGYVAAAIMSNLIDLKAKELLPEIKRLHDSGYVNLNICGPYKDVEREIKSTDSPLHSYGFTGIKNLYAMLRQIFGK